MVVSLGRLAIDGEQLLLSVEGEATDLVHRTLTVFLATHTAEDSLHALDELLHGERLSDVVVSTFVETFEYVFLLHTGGEEDDRHLRVHLTNVLSQRETVFFRHHHVEDADVELLFLELSEASLAVGAERSVVAFGNEVLTEQASRFSSSSQSRIFTFSSIVVGI